LGFFSLVCLWDPTTFSFEDGNLFGHTIKQITTWLLAANTPPFGGPPL